MPVPSTRLRRTLLGSLCVTALVIGACSSGDKTPVEEITVDAPSLGLSQADETALPRYFQIDARPGDEATTLQLLEQLGLGAVEGLAAERVIDGSTARFNGWDSTINDTGYTADSISFIGLHQVDGEATFDKMIVSNFADVDFEGEGEDRVQIADVRVAELTIISPTLGQADALAEIVLLGGDAVYEFDVAPFQALHLKDMQLNLTNEEAVIKVTLGQMVIGNDEDEERVDLVVETIDFDWKSETDPNAQFVLKMDGMTALGVDVADDSMNASVTSGFTELFSGMLSPSGRLPYRQIDLGTVDFQSAMFDLQMDGMEANIEAKGAETTLRSVLAPMTLTIKNAEGTFGAPYMEGLRNNGLDVITLKGSQTTTLNSRTDRMTVSAALEIDEGLRMRCDYALEGINAAATAREEIGVTQPVLDIEDVINEYFAIAALDCAFQDIDGNSLVERVYKVASEVTGSPVAVLKGSAKTVVALGSMMAPTEFERDLMDIMGSGLIDFINTPGQTMRIQISPEEPVSIMTLMGGEGKEPTIESLGLTVEVE